MKKILVVVIGISIFLTGCDSLRFAPTELQKQNAWLHNRTAQAAADIAKSENTSDNLKELTSLCSAQSNSFVAYYGLPQSTPPADSVQQILSQDNQQLAKKAADESSERPNGWDVADNTIETLIAIAALFGGVYGTRAASFLKQAKINSKALQEIVAGNELFKKQNTEIAPAFKNAHKNQSPETRQLVTQMKQEEPRQQTAG